MSDDLSESVAGLDLSPENLEKIPLIRICRTPDCQRVVAAWSLYKEVSDLYSHDNGWTDPETPTPRPYEIRQVEGKGRGMFANRPITRGEVIIRERPIIMIPGGMISKIRDGCRPLESKMFSLIRCLEKVDILRVLCLHNCKSPYECGPLAGILRTNAVCATWDEAKIYKNYRAICLDISRANHSCDPNAYYAWERDSVTFTLIARRDIETDEEICISYTDLNHSYAQRQAELQLKYKFACRCPKCSAYMALPESRTETAQRERFIAVLTTRLKLNTFWLEWMTLIVASAAKHTPCRVDMDAAAERAERDASALEMLLHDMDSEGMRGTPEHQRLRIQACMYCATIYSQMAHKENFQRWALRCVKEAKVLWKEKNQRKRKKKAVDDEFGKIVKEWKSLAETPISHDMWNIFDNEEALREAVRPSLDDESVYDGRFIPLPCP